MCYISSLTYFSITISSDIMYSQRFLKCVCLLKFNVHFLQNKDLTNKLLECPITNTWKRTFGMIVFRKYNHLLWGYAWFDKYLEIESSLWIFGCPQFSSWNCKTLDDVLYNRKRNCCSLLFGELTWYIFEGLWLCYTFYVLIYLNYSMTL